MDQALNALIGAALRRPRRLEVLPDNGRVVVAHPAHAASAEVKARELGLDYLTTSYAPTGRVWVLDVDDAPLEDLEVIRWHERTR